MFVLHAVGCSFTMTANVLRLGVVGDFQHKTSYEAAQFKFSTNVHTKNVCPHYAKPLLVAVAFSRPLSAVSGRVSAEKIKSREGKIFVFVVSGKGKLFCKLWLVRWLVAVCKCACPCVSDCVLTSIVLETLHLTLKV